MMHESMWTGSYGMWFGGHWLFMLLWVAILLPPFWKIFSKAGFSGWLSLLVLIPVVNLAVFYVLAFSEWPALRQASGRQDGRGYDK